MTYVSRDSVIIVSVLLSMLGIASVFTRFRVRMITKALLGRDDWLCLLALVNHRVMIIARKS